MYQTLFELKSTSPIDWWNASAGFLVIAFAAIALIKTRGKANLNGVSLWLTLAFFFLWTLLSTGLPYLGYQHNLGLFESGHFHVAEGPVEVLCSQTDGKGESFIVGGRTFSYTEYESLGRFHQPHAFGGPIRNRLYLRISYVNENDIVRLEKLKKDSLKRFPFHPQYTQGCD